MNLLSSTEQQQLGSAGDILHRTDHQVPVAMYCPISYEIMQDPVVLDCHTPCAHSFERSSIQQWIVDSGGRTCPMCNAKIRTNQLIPNTQLRETIAFVTAAAMCRHDGESAVELENGRMHGNTRMGGDIAEGEGKDEVALTTVEEAAVVLADMSTPIASQVKALEIVLNDEDKLAPIKRTELVEKGCYRLSYWRILSYGVRFNSNAIIDNDATKTLFARKVVNEGGVDVLLAAMRKYESNDTIQQACCEGLFYLASFHVECPTMIAMKGGVDLIVTAMRKHWTNDAVQETALDALQTVSLQNEAGQKRIGREEGVDAILTTMRCHKFTSSIQILGCQILRNISTTSDHATAIVDLGGLDDILTALRVYESQARVQEAVFGALQNILAKNKNARIVVANKGGANCMLAAMKKYESHKGIQTQCCLALRLLTVVNENNKAVVEGGGVGIILATMKNFGSNADIQKVGCDILANLAPSTNDNGNDNKHGTTRMVLNDIKGVVAVILSGMEKHESHAGVQEAGCSALCGLSPDKKLVAAGGRGVDRILMAMKNHEADANVQEQACFALLSLCTTNAENERLIVDKGGVNLVVSAMQRHECHSGVQEGGCRVLRNLSDNAETDWRILHSGGVGAIVAGMRTHETHEGVQEAGCGALLFLSESSLYIKKMIGWTGGMTVIENAMLNFERSPRIQKSGCGALQNLQEDAEEMGILGAMD